jgi:hypothetical protein
MLALAAPVLAGCMGPVVPEHRSGTSSDGLTSGGTMSESEVAELLQQVGFPASVIPKMVCTARYESSLDPGNVSPKNSNGSTDYGLFQINSVHLGGTPGCPSSADDLLDATINAQCALGVYDLQGLDAWVAYRSHKAECDSYDVDGTTAGPSTPTGATGADDSDPGTYGAGSPPADPGAGSPTPDPSGYDPSGYDPSGYDPSGYDPYGDDPYGYDPYGGGPPGGYDYGTDGMDDYDGYEGDEDPCDPYTGQNCGAIDGDFVWYF